MKKTTTCWIPTTTFTMNWWIERIKRIEIFGLVILSALFSCEDPSEIGLQLIDNSDGLDVVQAEFSLSGAVVWLDSINTTNRGIIMTGDYTDDDFGNVKVQSYLRLLPPAVSPNIPAEVLTADSLKMNLRYVYFYGDNFETPHQLSVHFLSEQLDTDSIYYSNNNTPYDLASIADTTFTISTEDTVLSINLESIKEELFQSMQQYEADSAASAEFQEQFKGLTLISDAASNAVIGFSPQAVESVITLYYTTSDTVVNTVNLRYSNYYNQITPDFSGSNLADITPLMEFQPPDGKMYLQTGTGIVPKIDFQPYFDFLDEDTTGTFVINKAELLIENLEGLRASIAPPVQMGLYYPDENNRFLKTNTVPQFPNTVQSDVVYVSASRNKIDPFNLNSQSLQLQLDTATVTYNPELTLFLQLIADGQLLRDDIDRALAVPFSFVENPTSVRDFGRNLDRFVVDPQNMRLKITYTRLR